MCLDNIIESEYLTKVFFEIALSYNITLIQHLFKFRTFLNSQLNV